LQLQENEHMLLIKDIGPKSHQSSMRQTNSFQSNQSE